MNSTDTSQFERLYNLEKRLVKFVRDSLRRPAKKANRKAVSKRSRRARIKVQIFSPWLAFWLTVGAFFFAFQAFLFFYLLNGPLSAQTELYSALIGLVLSLAVGLTVVRLVPNKPTDWRLPSSLFLFWMLLPSVFPLLFLIGIIIGNQGLIEFQNSEWRIVVEVLLFGIGLLLLARFYKLITPTQGAVTIILLSALFITKSLLTDGFYLAGRCPTSLFDERLAWMSNTAEEIKVLRQRNDNKKFYQTPLGQFVCTRTQEDIFR